jgi:anti-sigma-K factor RskA
MQTINHVDDLIAVYALGALPGADRVLLERHLQTCAECRALLRETDAAVAALPAMVAPLEPSAALKSRLLARVDANIAPQEAAASTAPHGRAAQWARQPGSRRAPSGANRDTQWAVIRRKVAPALVFASLLLLLGFGVRTWMLQAELSTAQAQASLLNDPALRITDLPVASAPANARARLFNAPQSSVAVLAVSSLRLLPPAQTYEFWLIRDGKTVRAGIFNVDASGAALVRIDGPAPLGQFEQAGLTIEKAGGVDAPTLNTLVFIGAIR